MDQTPKDDVGEGAQGVASDASPSENLRDGALQSFNPFNDVFDAPAVLCPGTQAFNDSRPEDAWTENESSSNLFEYLRDGDPLWWVRNMLPDFPLAEGGTPVPRDAATNAIPPPPSLQHIPAAMDTAQKNVDDKELPSATVIGANPGEKNVFVRSKGSSKVHGQDPALPKTIRKQIPSTGKQPRDFESSANTASRSTNTVMEGGTFDELPSQSETLAVDLSRAISAMQPQYPSSTTATNTGRKRKQESPDCERETKHARLRVSAPNLSSEFDADALRPRRQGVGHPMPYQAPTDRLHHRRTPMHEYFPTIPRDGHSTSAFEDGAKPRTESAYPDPSLYTLATPVRANGDQSHASFQHLQVNGNPKSIWTDLPRPRAQSPGTGDGARQVRRPTVRNQRQATSDFEAVDEKKTIDWPGQRPPDLTNLSAWPPPYPDMNRPGPGGPGTWPSDWIELESGRTQMKYKQFVRGTIRIPGRHPLQMYCYWFPNHIRDAALDHFRVAGWSGRKIWDHYHPDAVEDCREGQEKKHRGVAERPWNFLQQWFSRRKKELKREAAQGHNNGDAALQSDESSSDGSAHHAPQRGQRRPVHGQLANLLMPSTRSMIQTDNGTTRAFQIKSDVGLTSETGYFSTRHAVAPHMARNNQQAPNESRSSQQATAPPWWQRQLMILTDRVRQLLQLTDPALAQQGNKAQIVAAGAHLRRQFPRFAQSVWLQVLQGLVEPRDDLHPMNALRDIWEKLRQLDPHLPLPDEQVFCDGMMVRYLQYVSDSLDREEQKLHGPPHSLSFALQGVDFEAFRHPGGRLHSVNPVDPTTATSSEWLLHQPILFHGVSQSQHFDIGGFVAEHLVHTSSIPRADHPRDVIPIVPSHVFNQPGFSARGSPQTMSSAYVADIGGVRHRQQTIGEGRSSSKETDSVSE